MNLEIFTSLAGLSHFSLDTVFETLPALLSAVSFESSVDSVFHHRDKFLVAQEPITIVIKDLEN